MDASSALDPPERDDAVELAPFIRGDAPTGRTGRGSRSGGRAGGTVSRVGSGGGGVRKSVSTFIDIHLSSSQQRKNGLIIVISVLCFSLLVMGMIKKGAIGIEHKVEQGEHESVVHVDLDNHHQEAHVTVTKEEEEKEEVTTKVSKTENPPKAEAKTESSNTENPPKEVHIIETKGYQPAEMISPTFFLPGTEDAPRGSAAGGGFDYPLTNHFQYRNPDSPTAGVWGYFDFEDPKPEWRGKVRPIPDFASVPHRDVKGSDFPDGSWQKDDEYMKGFLREAKKLVNRTMEAVYAEYGVGVPGGDLSKFSDELLAQRQAFAPLTVIKDIGDDAEYNARGAGMWTTQDSLNGLARRIIHAIITQDTFHVALGGHSAAAGHGNGFNQSYIIQAGHVLEPVFAHLGVTMRSFNFAQGGLGTLQQAMAGMDLRGKETDVIMWDSSMTEKSQPYFMFFMKQALISGNRAPFMIGSGYDMRGLARVAGAHIGEHGSGWDGPVTVSEEQAKEVPWAARYLTCPRGETELCKKHEYEGNGCWVERDDYTPPTPQNAQPGGQTSWHPGNRIHKVSGRRIALLVLRGLEHALQKWEDLTAQTGHPLADEHWHVTDLYKSIKEKAPLVPGCPELTSHKIGQTRRNRRRLGANETERQLAEEYWPWRICNIPLQGRSLFGPRSNPVETSLLAIMKPNAMGSVDPTKNNVYVWPPVYLPPEMIGPWNVPPEDDIDVVQIAGARKLEEDSSVNSSVSTVGPRILADDEILPGYGLDINWGRPGHCDGSSHSWCDKTEGSNCLMGATQDTHGTICFNGLSGWLVFDVKGVKHGFIGARMEAWHTNKENKVTAGWTEVNNGGKGNYDKRGRERLLHEQNQRQAILKKYQRMNDDIEREVMQDPERRRLGGGQHCGFGEYVFEWALNGKIVSWSQSEFCDQYTRLAYNADFIRFLDDEKVTGDFELAMRIKNTSGSQEEMCITHLYWA